MNLILLIHHTHCTSVSYSVNPCSQLLPALNALLSCLFYKSILLTTNCNGQPWYKAAPILAVNISACIKPVHTDASARDFLETVSASHIKYIYRYARNIYMHGEAF